MMWSQIRPLSVALVLIFAASPPAAHAADAWYPSFPDKIYRRALNYWAQSYATLNCPVPIPQYRNTIRETILKCGGLTCKPNPGIDWPSVDFLDLYGKAYERVMGEDDEAPDTTSARKHIPHDKLSAAWRGIVRLADTYPKFNNTYANVELMNILPIAFRALTDEQKKASVGLPLHPADVKAFDAMGKFVLAGCHGDDGRASPCDCPNTICKPDPDDPHVLRITALYISQGESVDRVRIPKSIGDLAHLEALVLYTTEASSLPSSMAKLKRLRSLEITIKVKSKNKAKQLSVLGELTSLEHLSLSFRVGDKVPTSTWPSTLCRLTKLKDLSFEGYQGPLHPCLGDLTQLKRLKMLSNNFKGSSLPDSYGKLTQLQSFVAFQNGEVRCPKPNQNCRAKYVHTSEFSDPSDEKPFMCEDMSISGAIPDSLRNWHKIEKFWVDANFFRGPIPEWIGDDWPDLRVLDLYCNEMEGTVPPSIMKLTKLEEIQLQNNHFSGDMPPVHRLPEIRLIQLAHNTRLKGCFDIHEYRQPSLRVIVAGTQVYESMDCSEDIPEFVKFSEEAMIPINEQVIARNKIRRELRLAAQKSGDLELAQSIKLEKMPTKDDPKHIDISVFFAGVPRLKRILQKKKKKKKGKKAYDRIMKRSKEIVAAIDSLDFEFTMGRDFDVVSQQRLALLAAFAETKDGDRDQSSGNENPNTGIEPSQRTKDEL